jgi:hypothetical protein
MAVSIGAKAAGVATDKAEPRKIIAGTPERNNHFLSLIPLSRRLPLPYI